MTKENNLKINGKFVNDILFLVLIAVLGFAFFNLLTPFLPVIFIAIITVIFYHPVYKSIYQKLKNKGLSSAVTSIIVIVSLVIPTLILTALAAQQLNAVLDEILVTFTGTGRIDAETAQSIRNVITQGLERLGLTSQNPSTGEVILDIDKFFTNSEVINRILELIPVVLSTLSAFFDFFLKLFIMLFLIFFMFIEYENLPRYITKYSPLENGLDTLLFRKFVDTTKAIIKGSFAVAVIHATSIAIPMIVFDVPGVAIWWIIMFFFSIIPVGAGAVSVPIGLFMIYSPEYTILQGIFLILYSIISINLIESIVRPQLTKKGTGLHPLMILLSSLGGLIVYASPMGLLYGQLIAVFYKTVIYVYQEKYHET